MSDTNEQQPISNAAVSHQLGLLTGTVQQLHAAMTTRIEDIRADVRSLEASQRTALINIEGRLTHRIDGLEKCIGRRIDGLEHRVEKLEEEDKNFLKASSQAGSKAGGVSGGVVAALVAGAVELVKVISSKGF
jgi:CII-binding regulator of phage lambda lysogenization HflD